MEKRLLFGISFIIVFFLNPNYLFSLENEPRCPVTHTVSGSTVSFSPDHLNYWLSASDISHLYNEAFRAIGPQSGEQPDEFGYYTWDQLQWVKWFRKNANEGYWVLMDGAPPLQVPSAGYQNVNRALIYIDYCLKVKIPNQGFDYQNKLDLIVCGELQVGSLVITVTVPEVKMLSAQADENICGTGDVLLKGSVNFSEIDVSEVGFFIAPNPLLDLDGNDINIYDGYYGSYTPQSAPAFSPQTIQVITTPSPLLPGNIPYNYQYCWKKPSELAENFPFQIISYAKNATGYGLSQEIILFPVPSSPIGSKSFDGLNISSQFQQKSEKEGETSTTSTMNNFTLTLCDSTSLFKVDNLIVGNNTTLNVNGTFYVSSISGPNNNNPNSNTQGFCVNGSGVIMTPDGEIPAFCNIDGWSNGYFNDNGICVPILNSEGEVEYPSGYTPGSTTNNCGFSDGTLPIELLSLGLKVIPDRIVLNWTTGTEINNDYFTIERSRDLYGWEVLGFVEGAGNSSIPLDYSFTDYRPLDGLGYYRLKQTDFDGAFKYYGPIAAHYDLGLDGLDFKVMKNYTNWVIAVPNDGFYQVEVYNLQGHRLHSERVENTLSIPAPEGAVVIRVTDGFERSASRVVM